MGIIQPKDNVHNVGFKTDCVWELLFTIFTIQRKANNK